MAFMLPNLKHIDDKTKDTVFGYIRQQQKTLSLSNICPLISYLCLSYYYQNEYFTTTKDHEITISENRMKITKHNGSGWINTTYGNVWIDSSIPQIAKWKIKITNGGEYGVYIAFVSQGISC